MTKPEILTRWFEAQELPARDGHYQVKTAAGTESWAIWSGGAWQPAGATDTVREVSHWRGQVAEPVSIKDVERIAFSGKGGRLVFSALDALKAGRRLAAVRREVRYLRLADEFVVE